MKKVLASAGLVALSAASLQAAYAPDLTRAQTGKPWSISASLRGFYDDNYTTSPERVGGRDIENESYGFEIRPSVTLNLPLEQTSIGAGYTYSMRYYEDRRNNRADHMHDFFAKLTHNFSPRYRLDVNESFVYSQEPTLVDNFGPVTAPVRTDADVIRNRGAINFRGQLTELFGIGVGYANLFYDYDQDGPGSRSALLDRLEHLATVDFRMQIQPTLVGLIGYQFGVVDYTGDDFLLNIPFGPVSDDRDAKNHYFYVGADYDLTSRLSASARVGAQYVDYDNVSQSEVNPYADVNMTYQYMQGSFVQAGFKHTRNATDIAAPDATTPTLDQESSAVYAAVNHQFTAKFGAHLLTQYQWSEFNEGLVDGEEDRYWILGLNLDYRFTRNWAVEGGYNYDLLESDLPNRSFSRNRVYVGVRATY